MLNNKGFAVSTVLYTLLIAFLMFLGVALAQFSSSSSFIAHANDDLINGTTFKVVQVKKEDSSGCSWKNDTMVKITSKYGTIYWPKDFKTKNSVFNKQITVQRVTSWNTSTDNKIIVKTITGNPNGLNFNYNYSNDQIDKDGLFITIEDICK